MITKRHAVFGLQCVMSVTLLALLFRSLDLAALLGLFATLPVWFYLFSLMVMVAGQLLYSWRWRLLLGASGLDVPLTTVTRYYFIGIFLNNFFPSTVGGDMAKVYYLGRQHGYRPVAASIVLDRLLSIGSLAVLAAGMYWIAPDPAPGFAAARTVVTLCAIGIAAMVLLVARGHRGSPSGSRRSAPASSASPRASSGSGSTWPRPSTIPRIFLQSAGVVVDHFTTLTVVYAVRCREAGRSPAISHVDDGRHHRVTAQQCPGVGQRPRHP